MYLYGLVIVSYYYFSNSHCAKKIYVTTILTIGSRLVFEGRRKRTPDHNYRTHTKVRPV